MKSATPNGVADLRSRHSVDETVADRTDVSQAKGTKLFAVIDHTGEAAKTCMEMPPTNLLIFENRAAGTPTTLPSPRIALDLPLKMLVWENLAGDVRVSYNSPACLQTRHGLPDDLVKNIA